MPDLVKRLEGAAAGSRELDAEVARLFGWHRVEPRFTRSKKGGWIAPEDFIGVNSDGSPRLDGLHGTDIHRTPPSLTTSIDAAVALAERVLPDETFWNVSHHAIISGKKMFNAEVWPPVGTVEQPDFYGHAATPALALCAAILRAHAEQVQG